MDETREHFLKRMEEMNAQMRIEFEHLKCLDCANLSFWDGYYCEKGKHSKKYKYNVLKPPAEYLSLKPLKNCSEYCKRDVDWFWGLDEENLDKFYPKDRT